MSCPADHTTLTTGSCTLCGASLHRVDLGGHRPGTDAYELHLDRQVDAAIKAEEQHRGRPMLGSEKARVSKSVRATIRNNRR